MRKTLAVLMLFGMMNATSEAKADHKWERCSIHWTRSTEKVVNLIECTARVLETTGGPEKAKSVAACESGYNPKAYNATGCGGAGCVGIFQHIRSAWYRRAALYGYAGYSPFNARANIWVSLRMVKAQGSWSGWACA